MVSDNNITSEQFKSIHLGLAGDALPPAFAKLYSHYTRINMSQPGLKGWRADEFQARLADAIILIDVGLYEKDLGVDNGWRDVLKRAGELLEWLSHPDLNIEKFPLRLISAGLYQIAGYPALSLGLLNSEASDSKDSQILISLLKADFPRLLDLNIDFWTTELIKSQESEIVKSDQLSNDLSIKIVIEIVKALGVLCAFMRWGDTRRLEQAQEKLHDLSKLMVYDIDSYSWLLSKIVFEVVKEYAANSFRTYIEKIQDGVSDYGKIAFERYIRSNYQSRKSLAWYSQIRGIERLIQDGSFTLCTPTGSGKTTIAELAIIQSMFPKDEDSSFIFGVSPIAMYLVPSRALASEVEAKLGTVLGNLGSSSVKVTGLYGGIDWGPTDAWITADDPTVLICTYEKAEALIRFLGPLFLMRVSLVIIDEVHSVQYHSNNLESLRNADDRSLRLEILTNRLLRYIGNKRIIALSAVAEENELLAHWISGSETSQPVVSEYRSTRQLIGRLEWNQSGQYEIRFDILNGKSLSFDDGNGIEDVPYIQKPFAHFPVSYISIQKKFINKNNGVSKRQRPYLFWAVMQLAQPDEQGNQHSVLISVTQHVGGYAEDFLYVLNKTLTGIQLPQFFTPPTNPNHKDLFERCLAACADYFGIDSHEYQLLLKGIVVHHGNMPGLLARLMVEVLQKHVVHIALATSTLSEGVNLPFETVIVPTLIRNGEPIPVPEFKNLAGRAGRPGWGTEGRTLAFLEAGTSEYSSRKARSNYKLIIDTMTKEQLPEDRNTPLSPLAALLSHIGQEWRKITGSTSLEQFLEWLEKTTPLEEVTEDNMGINFAEEALDSLDGYLISIVVEQQEMSDKQMSLAELEEYLIEVWQKTYAYHVTKDKDLWKRVFLKRGIAIRENIYPETDTRRRLYRTSVSPRFGKKILERYQSVRNHLITGNDYAHWTEEERVNYITEAVKQVSDLGKFKVKESTGKGRNEYKWNEILKWWLCPATAAHKPTEKEISNWIKFVKGNFEYKFNWGLGTVLSLVLDDVNEGIITETSIENWPKTGLPWIVFWLKELIVWGTLDPAATLLLAHRCEYTRQSAENKAREYYLSVFDVPVDAILDPSKMKKWVDNIIVKKKSSSTEPINKKIKVKLLRDFSNAQLKKWRVIPISLENSISWIDPAGYELATSDIPDQWPSTTTNLDFELDIYSKTIQASKFMRVV